MQNYDKKSPPRKSGEFNSLTIRNATIARCVGELAGNYLERMKVPFLKENNERREDLGLMSNLMRQSFLKAQIELSNDRLEISLKL